MKKNIRIIIICLIAVLVLGGAAAALLLTAPEKEEETSSEPEETSRLMYDKNPSDISEITIENEHGTYRIQRVGDGDDIKWAIEGVSGLPISSDSLGNVIENAATLTAQQTVAEAPEDISIYGLDAPSAKVTTVFTDGSGTTNTLILGNEVPDGINRYFMLEGDNAVYTARKSDMQYFLNDKYDLVNKVIYKAKTAADENDTTDYTRINKMTISRKDLDYDVIIEYDVRQDDESIMTGNSTQYVMTSPAFRDLNPETSSEITSGIFGFTATDLGILNPTEEDIAECGLADPEATVKAEINGGDTLDLRIGDVCYDEDGGKLGRYVIADGINIIYVIDEASLPWLTFEPIRIVTTMFTGNYVFDLDSMNIKGENIDMNFTMTGSSDDDFEVKLDGNAVDKDKFKSFYQFILRAPSDDFCFEKTDAKPVLTIEINTKNGGGDVIEFIPWENRKSLVRLNGEVAYTCATAYVDRLIKNIDLYSSGEDIVTNW